MAEHFFASHRIVSQCFPQVVFSNPGLHKCVLNVRYVILKCSHFCPSTRRMGDILFLVWIPSASSSALASVSVLISVHYLLNQLMDFDQTYIETLLERGKGLINY